MKFYKMSKGVTEHYTSLEELRAAWGLSPVIRQNKDKNKLGKQREVFLGKHLCSACKMPMTYIGGNQLVCQNIECKGIKHETKLEDGNVKIWYTPSFDLLDDKGSEIAYNLFTEFCE